MRGKEKGLKNDILLRQLIVTSKCFKFSEPESKIFIKRIIKENNLESEYNNMVMCSAISYIYSFYNTDNSVIYQALPMNDIINIINNVLKYDSFFDSFESYISGTNRNSLMKFCNSLVPKEYIEENPDVAEYIAYTVNYVFFEDLALYVIAKLDKYERQYFQVLLGK